MKFLKSHKGICAFLMFAMLFCAIPVYSQISGNRPSETFSKVLIRSVLWVQNRLEPVRDGVGRVGTNAVHFGASFVDSTNTREHIIVGDQVGGPNGAVLVRFVNNSGSALAAGDWAVYDTTGYVVVDSTAADVGDANAAIADSLEQEVGKFTLVAKANGTVATDSIIVKGTKVGIGSTVVDTLILTDGAETFTVWVDGSTRVYWTKVDSVAYDGVDGALSIQLEAIPFANIKASGGATTDFAGVVVEAIADADSGFACIFGPVDAVVDAGTLRAQPGTLLELASGGDAVTDAAATTGQNVGRAMEYSNKDNWLTRVFVGNQ